MEKIRSKERECLTMGCDIHGGLEIKDLSGKWHPASSIVQNLTNFDKGYASDLPLGRNYTLFSILEADHPRNYNKVKSIAPARGLPKDTTYAGDFNKSMQNKLIAFVARLHQLNCSFSSKSFANVDIPDNAFVYCDPPYTITTACYGNQYWNKQNDQGLFAYLDELDQRGIKFALSDVLEHKGVINQELEQWRQGYVTHSIKYDYNNSNYHSRAKQHKTREILVTNY